MQLALFVSVFTEKTITDQTALLIVWLFAVQPSFVYVSRLSLISRLETKGVREWIIGRHLDLRRIISSENPRSFGGHAGPMPNPLASSSVRRRAAVPYGYTLEDSTRFAPAGASKETAYAHHLNRPARRCCRAAGARYHLPRLCRRALRDRARARLGRLRAAPHCLGRSPAVPGVRRRKQGLCHWL